MKPLTCAATRRRLSAYHDHELAVAEQIAVAAHLEWCDDCARAAEDLQIVGTTLRHALPGRTALTAERQLTFPGAVANRMKAERNVSWPVWFQRSLEDGHLVYAAGAAAVAALVCVIVMLGMMRFATSTPRPDSLAALIDILTPGSNQNPVVPRPNVLPRPLDSIAFSAEPGLDDEAMFMLAATVTREGRVENLALVPPAGDDLTAVADHSRVVANLLDAVSRARFEPASVAGLPVAVNMVWMVAHTTVRGASPQVEPAPAEPPVRKRRIAATLTAAIDDASQPA